MKKKLPLLFLVLAVVVAACESGGARPPSAPAAAGPPAAPLPIEEQVKILSAASRPGPRHAALAELAGEWDVALSIISAAGTETDPYHGRATLEPVLGGRFLKWEATIQFGSTGRTTTGFLGFDSRIEEYELLMISDLSQTMGVAHGTGELAGPGIVFTLEQLDPRSGAKLRARSRIRWIEKNHFVLEQIEAAADGTDHATRVWHYRRSGTVKR